MSVQVNPDQLLQYMLSSCGHIQNVQSVAFQMASRYGLPGCESGFTNGFNQAMIEGDYAKAA